jgi:hypothetical protein
VISGTHFSFTFSNEEGETTLHQHKGSRQKSHQYGTFNRLFGYEKQNRKNLENNHNRRNGSLATNIFFIE